MELKTAMRAIGIAAAHAPRALVDLTAHYLRSVTALGEAKPRSKTGERALERMGALGCKL